MRICFIGDSFVNGVGDPDYLGWVGRICRSAKAWTPDLTAYNLGIRRDTSTGIHARWQAETACRLPTDVNGRTVFSFGVNDCISENGSVRVFPERSLDNARHILENAASLRPTLMIGPPPITDGATNQRIEALSYALAALCKDIGVPYLPVFEKLHDHTSWIREAHEVDGAHPGAEGYAALAGLVQEWPVWKDWHLPS